MKIYQKKLLLTFSIIIIFIVGLYLVHYKRYVINAPKTHIEARKDYVNALTIHFFYLMLVKAGIDYQNPIIAPIKNARDYFYKRGMSKLSPIDSERTIWFHVFEMMPYNLSSGGYGNMLKKYGKEYGYKFLDDTFKYIVLLADKDPIDKSFKDNKYVVQAFFDLLDVYTTELKVDLENETISKKNIKLLVKEKSFFNKFLSLYEKRNFFLKEHNVNNFLRKNYNNFYGDYHRFYNNSLYISSMILFYKIKNNLFQCENDKKYFRDIFISKKKIREYVNEINSSASRRKGKEILFQRLKIPNTRYDKKYSDNPFKMYVNCNYDDIFIKEGN
ncbi:hypothetical protein Arnit_1492 [Arcobacter nitrofigilis DSM 7299]|uniref:Uncharacterized protein n=1 Tax=Arcobacter nitrofigilis (strain ATCC 33309 / DSM 7299 / CCUG 15893 / LMG 7604 / NCTC 12251 / CI) TaxID=572480 RepID=D5V5Y1_ARCNC|nr:hypothetical protein [Arcobacter nitrofigilis]ADG93148.1 hypothetical protein Arnit_1492 [Arcobacter nitrofigilis DSM 7299]